MARYYLVEAPDDADVPGAVQVGMLEQGFSIDQTGYPDEYTVTEVQPVRAYRGGRSVQMFERT